MKRTPALSSEDYILIHGVNFKSDLILVNSISQYLEHTMDPSAEERFEDAMNHNRKLRFYYDKVEYARSRNGHQMLSESERKDIVQKHYKTTLPKYLLAQEKEAQSGTIRELKKINKEYTKIQRKEGSGAFLQSIKNQLVDAIGASFDWCKSTLKKL